MKNDSPTRTQSCHMVKNKLSSWKTNQLSYAGRVTLSKAVVEAKPLYPMMTSVILKSCQQLHGSFIWGDSKQHRCHAVGWSSITTPRKFGYLRSRNLITFNSACSMKLGWVLRQGEDKLWCQVLHGKYDRDVSDHNGLVVKPLDSPIWKQMNRVGLRLVTFILGQWLSACVQDYEVAMSMSRSLHHRNVERVEVKWDHLGSGWISLNCDGFVKASNKVTSCGSLM